jgi:hypothetical protein
VVVYEVPDVAAPTAASRRSVPTWAVPLTGCQDASADLSADLATQPELFALAPPASADGTASDEGLLFAACAAPLGQRLLHAVRASSGAVQWKLRLGAPAAPGGGASTGGAPSGWARAAGKREGGLAPRRAAGVAAKALGQDRLAVWAEEQETVCTHGTRLRDPLLVSHPLC